MEVMEDGNLMDKVNILIQRDMEYYKARQSVLQETVCAGIIGGRLDFPRSASFAAVKLVVWWEDEYVAAFRKASGFFQKNMEGSRDSMDGSRGCGGIVRSSDPGKFISAISKSADQLLEHLHILSQEALDHADLTVLTGTIGAAALLKNCLWFYIQILNEVKTCPIDALQNGYKNYNEMCEALAERLLDLHCRLLSLYILQDADCLDWENNKPFFESERGSYNIQMWWLYMQGTREDLWNTVPPKMAQRVFSGMLNESLTILTIRYTQSSPSEARSELLLVDISNLLLCVAQLLPSICDSSEEFIGFLQNNRSKILKDIHVKCQDLFCCFLLRGAPLETLYKVFKKDINAIEVFTSKTAPAFWIIFAMPNIFKNFEAPVTKMKDLDDNSSLALELMVLLAQPQPNWALLLRMIMFGKKCVLAGNTPKMCQCRACGSNQPTMEATIVLCNRNFKVIQLLLNTFLEISNTELQRNVQKPIDCGNFLCPVDGSCKNVDTSTSVLNKSHYYDLIMSATDVVLYTGNNKEFNTVLIQAITKYPGWAKCFDRKQVWNQNRYPWYDAILNLASPILPLVVETVINALQTGATMYQAMSIIIACLSQFWDVINESLPRIAAHFQDAIPTEVTPLGNLVLIQLLGSALYTNLIGVSENKSTKKEVSFQGSVKDNEQKADDTTSMRESRDSCHSGTESIALAAAEALCSIDEDNKHTDQIQEFMDQVNLGKDDFTFCSENGSKRVESNQQMTEILVSDLLMTSQGKKSLKTLFHFIKHNSEWMYNELDVSDRNEKVVPNKVLSAPEPLLKKMFHVGYRPFDQLLSKQLKPNWQILLQNPMGLTPEKVWMQISLRWEFRDITSSRLCTHDVHIINHLTSILKQ